MKKVLIIIYLLLISSIIPFFYLHQYGKTYVDNDGMYHQLGSLANDNYTHSRMIKEMSDNIFKRGGIKLYVNNHDPSLNFPLFQYYNFGPYFLSSFLYLIISNPYIIYILSYIIPLFIASLGMFCIAKQNNLKNLFFPYIAPLLYVFSPYMIIDILQRNAYSEVWAFCFLPMLYFFINRILKFPSFKNIIVWLFFSTIFLTSHNITVLYSLILLIPFLISKFFSKSKTSKLYILVFVIPFLISIFYLEPIFLNNKNLVVSSSFTNLNSTTYLSALPIILSPIPFTSKQINQYIFPIQLGLPILFILLLLFKHKKIKKIMIILSILLFICFPLWNIAPKIFYSIQFPYRLMVFVVFFACIYITSVRETFKKNIIFLFLILVTSIMYFRLPYYYLPRIFSYSANYRNSFYFNKNEWKGHNDYAINTFISLSKNLFSKSSIITNKTSQKTLYAITCNGLCTNTIWLYSKNIQNVKDVYIYIYLISNQKKNDDIIKLPLNQLGSFCVTKDIKSIQFELVNFSTDKELSLDEINIYEVSNKIRPVQINNKLILSTCAINKHKDSIDFIFDEKSTLPKALPYYYSTENIVISKGKIIPDTIPGLDKLGNSYTLILKTNNTKFTIEDSFFPKNIFQKLKYSLFN